MKKLIVFLVLSGCATQGPTNSQLALWAYFSSLCGQNANYDNIENLLRTNAALRGCVTMHAIKADAAYRAGQTYRPNPIEASGNVLLESASGSKQQTCDTKPALGGGFTTTCY